MSGGGHGGKSRGKKRAEHHEEHEEHVNHEAWVIPYADVLTLLMALFLVLFALGLTDQEKADIAAMTWRKSLSAEGIMTFGINTDGSFGTGGSGPLAEGSAGVLEGVGSKPAATEENNGGGLAANEGEPRPAIVVINPDGTVTEYPAVTVPEVETAEDPIVADPLDYVEEKVRIRAEGTGLIDKIGFRREPRGLVVTIVTDQVLFEPGQAVIQPGGFTILDVVADALADLSNDVLVEGHTDSRPISTSQFPSNWELSTARATNVLRYLVEARGFPAERISAAGYADTHPVDTSDSQEALGRNRRVEIIVLGTTRAEGTGETPATTTPAETPAAPATTEPAGLEGQVTDTNSNQETGTD
jgi:chemotaxis protein MotB